jgi:hypothetical protein
MTISKGFAPALFFLLVLNSLSSNLGRNISKLITLINPSNGLHVKFHHLVGCKSYYCTANPKQSKNILPNNLVKLDNYPFQINVLSQIIHQINLYCHFLYTLVLSLMILFLLCKYAHIYFDYQYFKL